MTPGTLFQDTLRLVQERKHTLPEIEAATGLPLFWLKKFASGKIPDPSVNRVQILCEYLAGTTIPRIG